jgi:hypothetical protein
VPPSRKAGLSVGIFSSFAFGGCSSWPDFAVCLAGFHRNRDDFGLKAAVGNSFLSSGQSRDGILVLRLTGELIALGAVLREGAHQAPLVIGVLKPVQEHMVKHPSVTHTVSGTRSIHQVWCIGHAFHATRNSHVRAAG